MAGDEAIRMFTNTTLVDIGESFRICLPRLGLRLDLSNDSHMSGQETSHLHHQISDDAVIHSSHLSPSAFCCVGLESCSSVF